MPADYVYSARSDNVRVRIFRREEGTNQGWDFDVFKRGRIGIPNTLLDAYTVAGACSAFPTRKAAKAEAERQYGKLRSINPRTVVEGW